MHFIIIIKSLYSDALVKKNLFTTALHYNVRHCELKTPIALRVLPTAVYCTCTNWYVPVYTPICTGEYYYWWYPQRVWCCFWCFMLTVVPKCCVEIVKGVHCESTPCSGAYSISEKCKREKIVICNSWSESSENVQWEALQNTRKQKWENQIILRC